MKQTHHSSIAEKINEFIKELPLETYQGRTAMRVAIANILVLDEKQQDYGPYNICGNPHPELGVAFRAGDKIQRLMNLFLEDGGNPKHESIADSWMDLSNYGTIGSMLHTGIWLESDNIGKSNEKENKNNSSR